MQNGSARIILTLTCLMLLLSAAPAAGQQGGGEVTLTMALTGDSIITRKLSVYQEPEFLSMIELIRGVDMAFTNLEVLLPWRCRYLGSWHGRGGCAVSLREASVVK